MLATDAQVGFFFSIVNSLGEDAVEYKERAKTTYGLESFNDITSEQISTLINKMIVYAEKKGISIKFPEKEVEAPPHAPQPEPANISVNVNVVEKDPTDEWAAVPERVKPVEQFKNKDWREVVDKFNQQCEHDWVVAKSEFDKFTLSRCVKCPSVKIEAYKDEPYRMLVTYEPIKED